VQIGDKPATKAFGPKEIVDFFTSELADRPRSLPPTR
jgi:hypothetical protein